jgi:hypothetical protein
MMSIAAGNGRRRSPDPSLRNSGKVPSHLLLFCKIVLRSQVLKRMKYSMMATINLEISDRLDVI